MARDNDFDDDLDELLTQQCIDEGDKIGSQTALQIDDELRLRVRELETLNASLKGEVTLLRNRSATESSTALLKQKELENQLEYIKTRYEKAVNRLSAELEFKEHQTPSHRKRLGVDLKERSSISEGSSFSTSSTKRTSSETALLKMTNGSCSYYYNQNRYEFYQTKYPRLISNNCYMTLTEKQKKERMEFFRTKIEPYRCPLEHEGRHFYK